MPTNFILQVSLLILGITLVSALLKRFLSRHPDAKYPPGPRGRLFVGNLLDIPNKKPWLAYTGWAKTYGDVMHLQVLNDHVIVLSSAAAASDLLEKRSRIYSGRPYRVISAAAGWDFLLSLQDYSDTWRKNRKVYQQTFRPDAVTKLLPAIHDSIGSFLKNLFESPRQFISHIDA
ncbi:hypothetical protein VNI00_010743 [Paramarasmius palmivorus]|uniref:Cytochrome P450 n=1 Tax=Paramarasmius palmivorus TaxID=297713 RepID=A0AAW0CDH9_9AGAR